MNLTIPEDCTQLLFVLGDHTEASLGDAFLLKRLSPNEWKVLVHDRIMCGKNGWTDSKVEGDGKSPIGVFKPLFCFGKFEPKPFQIQLPYLQTHADLVAVDDPNSKYYNHIVDLRIQTEVDWNSAEDLLRTTDNLYDIAMVCSINYPNVEAGKGSCLFHHVRRITNTPTAGCIAYHLPHLKQILGQIQLIQNPFILQGPREVLQHVLNMHKFVF